MSASRPGDSRGSETHGTAETPVNPAAAETQAPAGEPLEEAASEAASAGSQPEADPGAASPPAGDDPACEPDDPDAASSSEADSAPADPLAALAAERDQHLEDLQRMTAEFANFRRQSSKRAAEVSAQAGARLAEALLVVFDACEAAARQGVEGVEEIAGQLTAVLTREGLEVIHDDGEAFDPARHEATMRDPADPDSDDAAADSVTGPLVAETLRTGYAWNGRVLRAAMVRVKG